MRNLLVAACLVLPAMISNAWASDPALVSVEDPQPSTVRALLTENVLVVRDMGRYLLVLADARDLSALDSLGLEWSVLDSDTGGKTYYTVTMRADSRRSLAANARVLRQDRYDAVVEASPAEAERLAAAGFEVARVFFRAVRAAPGEKPVTGRPPKAADPFVQQLVAAVSGAQIDATVNRLEDFVTRYATTDSCQAAANWIKAQFESYGIDSVYFHHFSSTYKDNVVAVIPGAGDPSKIVLLGGHYDSISSPTSNAPGADDNASGTACALECARVLAGHEFNYTIVLIAFGGEELGLYGSEGYASDAAARGDDILGMVSVDMIGYLASGDALDLDIIYNTSSEWLRDAVEDAALLYVPDLPIVDGYLPGGASSDHASFWANGYDAILFFEDSGNYSPYIHTTNDRVGPSYNSPTLAVRSVRTAVALLASLAEPFTIAIRHTPLANTEDTTNPYRVVAEVLAAGAVDPDSLLVHYSTGAAFQTVVLTPTANPEEYEAYIPAQPGGTFVDYYLTAVDAQGHRAAHPSAAPAEVHRFFVGTITPLIVHDFETDQGWTVGAAGDNATTGVWERCDPQGTEAQPEDDHTPAPGVRAYITQCAAGSGQGSYDVDGGHTTLLSPVFDLTDAGRAAVRYYRWFSNDTGSAPSTDYWTVDVTDDDGTTWTHLEYTLESRRQWALQEFFLPDYITLTNRVRFRFIAADEGSGSIVEAGVDDFSLVVYEEETTGASEAASAGTREVLSLENVPNPFNPQTTLWLTVPAPGRLVTLRVFDVSGRLVKTLLEDAKLSGRTGVDWDGRDAQGREVSTGVYFARVEAGEETLTRKMVMIR